MAEFYVGQKVKIIDDTVGHDFEIGSVVVLNKANQLSDGYWDLGAYGRELDNDDCEPFVEKKLKGSEIAELIIQWANDQRMHPDDFDMLFANELLDKLEAK
jgi:hypothetical protein